MNRTVDGTEICETRIFDGEGKLTVHSVTRTVFDGNNETALTENFSEDGTIESEDKTVIEYVPDANGDRHLLHEEGWIAGKHIYETIYEYEEDNFDAVTITEKRFDLNCIEVSKTTVEYWD